MTDQDMINNWLKNNEVKVDTTDRLNRDTISVDFQGNIKRKPTARKATMLKKVIHQHQHPPDVE
jgi:hypothetical protein